MSFESVRNKCIANNQGGDHSKLDDDLNKVAARFEKIVKTSYNASGVAKMFNEIGVKDEAFQKHKLEYIHNHLTMLIDLYDYKAPDSLKKSS